MRLALAAACVLALVIPGSVHAQLPGTPASVTPQLNVFVDDPGHPMAPGKNETLDGTVSYSVQTGAQPTPDPNNANDSAQPTQVTFKPASLPSWMTAVAFDPPVLNISIPFPTTGQTVIQRVKVVVSIDPKAPALDKRTFTITATAAPNGNIAGATATSPEINLKPAFLAKANVTAPSSMVVKGGRWVDMPFTIKNLGNGNTTMKLNVTARPQDSQVEFPPTVNLSVDESKIVNVRLRVPWTYGEGGSLEFEATPLTENDDGRPAKAIIDVNGQSAVPGLGVPVSLLAAIGLALALRRP